MWRCAPVAATALAAALALGVAAAAPAGRPAILIHAPQGLQDWHVDLTYLKELRAAGFEVDYTDRTRDLTWERLRRFNVVVLFGGVEGGGIRHPSPPAFQARFLANVRRFVDEGGGAFLMIEASNADASHRSLLEPWGARIPLERIREAEKNLAPIPRMRGFEKLAFTDNVFPSPVSEGVRQIWYPYIDQKNAGMTSPIVVSDDWQVVVRGSKTSRSVPVTPSATRPAPDGALRRAGGEKQPALFAIRSQGRGRIAFCAMWAQFSIGQGTQWLYDRRVLSKGIGDRPSDFGRLLRNTFRWLAEPSAGSRTLGGYVTDDARMLPRNDSPQIRRQTRERIWKKGEYDAQDRAAWPLYRGLIGARTELSSGSGSVAAYAAAARRAGLDFLVFMEDFERLTPAKLGRLKAECRRHSAPDLLLLPGYRIDSNTGNHMFFFGDTVELPSADALLGQRLNRQFFDAKRGRYAHGLPVLTWILKHRGERTNAGYYRFLDDPRSQKLTDVRTYSVAAIRTYEGGQLVEDVTEDYLRTAQDTIPPIPVSVNRVASPQELEQAVASGQSLTWAKARSLDRLYADALDWARQLSGPHVFVSNGPIVQAWPRSTRTFTYAGESFVTGRTRMPSLLHVTSDVGLAEVRLFDGPRLFRRFLPGGRKQLELLLQLDGTVHRTLTLVAEDVKGGVAVSFPRRSWKEDNMAVAFCGDRVNDCRNGRLGHGPGVFLAIRNPPLSGGVTWDGGPQAIRPLLKYARYEPVLRSNRGTEGDRRFNNLPLLESADESGVSVRSVHRQLFDPAVPVGTAWSTYGPLDPSRLMEFELRFTEFARPGIGPSQTGWVGWPEERGALTALFGNTLTFKQDLRIERLELLRTAPIEDPLPVRLVFGKGDEAGNPVEVGPGRRSEVRRGLDTGEWLGVFADTPANSVLLLNRGAPLRVRATARPAAAVLSFDGDVAGRKVSAGQTLGYEMLVVSDPLDASARDRSRFVRLVRYLAAPAGLDIQRGRRVPSPGLLEIEAEDGAVDVAVAKPPERVDATLPVRVLGLNPRWSAGFFQLEGYNTSYYPGGGANRYRPAAVDAEGRALGALFPDWAPRTHVVIGHPVVADRPELFIQVTQKNLSLDPRRSAWHVSVNNPTDAPIQARFRRAMDLPGFDFEPTSRTVPAGGYLVLAD